jgi:hypothetical protein
MGQPINVVAKPSRTPGIARFETNRSLTGMGHERYASIDDVLDDRHVDQLARRLFATGIVRSVHVNSGMITVELVDGASGDGLLEVIRGLYIFYPPEGEATEPGVDEVASTGPATDEGQATAGPEFSEAAAGEGTADVSAGGAEEAHPGDIADSTPPAPATDDPGPADVATAERSQR